MPTGPKGQKRPADPDETHRLVPTRPPHIVGLECSLNAFFAAAPFEPAG